MSVATGSQNLNAPWRAAILRLEGAYAPSTLKAYRADFEAFEGWCGDRKTQSLARNG